MELAWATNDEIMSHGEGVVRRIAKTLLDERSDELASLDRDLDLVARYADNPYPRMRYDEAVETLKAWASTSSGAKTSTTARKRS